MTHRKQLLQKDKGLRINLTIRGPLADFARELRARGYARNIPDLVSQALRVLEQKVIQDDLARVRVDALKQSKEDYQ